MSSPLYKYFVAHNGEKGSLEKTAIEAFARLMPRPDWLPQDPYYGEFGTIIRTGMLAAILEGRTGAQALLSEVIGAQTGGYPADKTMLSELHTGALVDRLGGVPDFIKAGLQHGIRTPDIRATFAQQTVDVEVVRGDEREAHAKHRQLQETLTSVIHGLAGTRYDVHVAVELTQDVLAQIVDACTSTQIGAIAEVPGKWSVAIRPSSEGGGDKPETAPSWWRDVGPSFFVVAKTIGSSVSSEVNVRTPVPLTAYVGPVRRKAERPQRTGDHPYIIALDASDLFGAPGRLINELQDWFAIWPDVSAVLVFFPFFPISGNDRGWKCRLLRNPSAILKIQDSWISGLEETTLLHCGL